MIEWATMAEVARLFGWSESYARRVAGWAERRDRAHILPLALPY